MMAPDWINALIREFGKSARLADLSLNDRGAAAVTFETGVSLHFEYARGMLSVFVTLPAPHDIQTSRRILAYAHPSARRGFTVRSGYLVKSGRAVFAVRLGEREVTLPMINAAFAELWRIANEFGGAA
ncbi:MAG: hypothetical protein J6336_08280 [Kiritimatiellae bacterium]|nr:hypothetical protein [Kiritimatiellia bacterium]